MDLLAQVHQLILDREWIIGNIDSVIVAERPKLKPHLPAMINSLAQKLAIAPDKISVKATTNEKLGPVGREEGICAYAVVLLCQDN
jgi:2-C-methyl-D-erythritol 2,4-cyclodiphosphate synthase